MSDANVDGAAATDPKLETPAAPDPAVTPAPVTPEPGKEAPKEAGTALSAPVDDKGAAVTATWPGDWREKLAGADKGFENILSRYTDPSALANAHKALLAKLNAGEVKNAPPANATPEQLATWRKDNGIPENAEGYVEKLKLPEGMALGDADKPLVAAFAADVALKANMSPAQVSEVMSWYLAKQEAFRQAEFERDDQARLTTAVSLKETWGPEYAGNLTAIQNLLAGAPAGVRENFEHARMPDGSKLGSHPATLQWLAGLSREINPAATLVPAGNPGGLTSRLEEISKIRQANPDAYDKDQALQAEELRLLEADSKIKRRAA